MRSIERERIIKLQDAWCLPCNKLYWIHCYWGCLKVEDANHLYFSFSRNSFHVSLLAFHFESLNHGYFANCSLSWVWTETQTTCWTDGSSPWGMLMSWITCLMSIVMSWWKLKIRSLPGLIKQPACSPLLTISRFKGKAPLSTTCLQTITLIWGVNCLVWLTGHCC